MESNEPYITKNEYGEFVIEGDSLDITYDFYGENAPIRVGVYNRMSKPVYIDWRQSGVVIDEQTVTYRTSLENFRGGITKSGDFSRYLNDPDGFETVRPYVKQNTQVLELTNFNFRDIPDSRFREMRTQADLFGANREYKCIKYDEDNSPIYIFTFLTIYEKADDMTNPLIFEAGFYLSELINGESTSPSHIAAFKQQRGDSFYVRIKKENAWKKVSNASSKVVGGVANVKNNIIEWALDGRGEQY